MTKVTVSQRRRHVKLVAEEAYPFRIAGEGREHLIARHIKPQPNGCWYWNDRVEQAGQMYVDGKTWRAHRLVYCLFHKLADLPPHLHLHHECRHRGCVNPEHMKLVTLEQHQAIHRGEAPSGKPRRSKQ